MPEMDLDLLNPEAAHPADIRKLIAALRAARSDVERGVTECRAAVKLIVKANNERDAARARLAAVLAVPACRDAGHTEAIHSAAGCCDPYEDPCAAFTVEAPDGQ